jgi:site-specific DNA recombinase
VDGHSTAGIQKQIVDGKKTIVIDPQQGAIMKWVFQELGKGLLTARSVMEKANEKGLITRSGRPCCKASFWAAIRNPVYCGKIKIPAYKGEEEQLVQGTPCLADQRGPVLPGSGCFRWKEKSHAH